MPMSKLFLLFFAVWNVFVFCLYHIDKRRAVRGRRRISERALLWSAALFGGMGALAAMKTAHHKTQKPAFVLGVPLMAALQMMLFLVLESMLMR